VKVNKRMPAGGLPVIDGTIAIDLIRRKRMGYSQGLGFGTCGGMRFGDNLRAGGIYKRRRSGYNNYTGPPPPDSPSYGFITRSYGPTNPQTVLQQAGRTKFATAVSTWAGLTLQQKSVYNKRGSKIALPGRNLFIREYMKTP